MKILAFDTATEACSAALLIDGAIRERFEIAPRGHARLLLPMLDALLEEAGLAPAGLDAIAFGRGPGSFTGLRIAAGIAQGIAFAADVPVVPVSTLKALARDALLRSTATDVLAAIDARMGEVYWAAYRRGDDGEPQPTCEEAVSSATAVRVPAGDTWFGLGSGWATYAAALRAHFSQGQLEIDAEALPRAAQIAHLAALEFAAGNAVAAELALPVYLRNEVAQRPGA